MFAKKSVLMEVVEGLSFCRTIVILLVLYAYFIFVTSNHQSMQYNKHFFALPNLTQSISIAAAKIKFEYNKLIYY